MQRIRPLYRFALSVAIALCPVVGAPAETDVAQPLTLVASTTLSLDPSNVPVDFFPGIVLDAPFPNELETGTPLRLSGIVSDPDLSRLSLAFVDSLNGRTRQFFAPVVEGKFADVILFAEQDAGDYVLEVYGGAAGGSLPLMGRFPRFTVHQGAGAFIARRLFRRNRAGGWTAHAACYGRSVEHFRLGH